MATDNPLPGAQPPAGGSQGDFATGAGTATSGATSPAAGDTPASPGSVTEAMRSAATDLLEQVKQQASSQANVQKERAADSLAGVADAVRGAGDRLREQVPAVASYVDTAVDQIEELSTTLRDKDPAEFVADLEDLARRRPALFIGGAFILGLALARFLKSSSHRRDGSWDDQRPGDRARGVGDYATAQSYEWGGRD